MAFIHELPGWSTLTWDSERLALQLAAVRHEQGRLLGKMEALGFDFQSEASLIVLTADVVKSSAIEGETLNADEVRSSIARRLGLDTAGLPQPSRRVEGVVEMMLDATQNSAAELTDERLYAWHSSLFPTGRSGMDRIAVGAWRPAEAGSMRVISGSVGNERVDFEAPDATRLPSEMSHFLTWFNETASIDPVLKAGLAHLWFVTIHPFEDGNGRIARAIADLALARADGTKERFYSMSAQIEAERNTYYQQLEQAQRGGLDVTAWQAWFLGCLGRAVASSDERLACVLFKARLWEHINRKPVNDRQRLVINRLLGDFQGFLTTSKYATLATCSADTALRDLKELLDRGVIVQNAAGGRSTSYRLAEPDGITS
jgi:Fic family protein